MMMFYIEIRLRHVFYIVCYVNNLFCYSTYCCMYVCTWLGDFHV